MIKILDFLIFPVVFSILNGIAFLVFALDKRAARKNIWRTSENLLLWIALLGPFGAFAAMRALRHKTRKLKFYLIYVCILLHTAIGICFFLYEIK